MKDELAKLDTDRDPASERGLGMCEVSHSSELMTGSLSDQDSRRDPIKIVASLTAAWLLAFYLLPHTVWGASSPFGVITDKIQALMHYSSSMGSVMFALVAVCVLFLFHQQDRPGTPSASKLRVVIGIYASVLILPGILHHTAEESAATSILLPLFAGLLAARLCSTSSSAIRLLSVLAAVQAIYELFHLKSSIHLNDLSGLMRPAGTFDNSDSLIILLIAALPIAIAQTLHCSKTAARTTWGISTTLLLGALVSTGSRVGLLAVLVATTFIVIPILRRWKLPLALGIGMLALAICLVQWKLPATPVLSSHSFTIRSAYLNEGIQHVAASFWSGAGIGSFDVPDTNKVPQIACSINLPPLREPGNNLVHWLEEFGISGGILYVAFVVVIVALLRLQERKTATTIRAAWIAILVAGCFDTPFGNMSHSTGTSIIGLLLGATMLPDSKTQRATEVVSSEVARPRIARITLQYGIPAAILCITAILSWSTLQTLKNHHPTTVQPIAIRAQEVLSGRTEFLGDEKSPYTLIEFADYECPPCRANRALVHDVLSRYQGKLKLDFRNLPLSALHPNAMYAAIVAEAARKQGAFWSTNSVLFDLTLDEPSIQQVVKNHLQSGVLPAGLLGTARHAVEMDVELANRLDLAGTPSFLLCCPDGKVYKLQTPESVGEIL